MISPNECAELLSVTHMRVKQLIKEIYSEDEIYRTKPENGQIKISPHQVRALLDSRGLSFKSTVATIGNEKGGVGKSLVSINVAIRRAQQGARVLIIDLDPEACATNFLLTKEDAERDFLTVLEVYKDKLSFKDAILPTKYEFLDIIPCRGKARRVDKFIRDQHLGKLINKKLGDLRDEYDLILFEIPPTFTSLIASAYITSDIIIIPTFPDKWSLESVILTLEDVEEAATEWEVPLPDTKILLNKYRADRKASKEAWETLITHFGNKVLPFQIKESAELQNAINEERSIWESGGKCPKIVKEAVTMVAEYICPISEQRTFQ